MSDTAVIGCDWGTSSLRAYRLGADGAVLERREAARGIMAIADASFEAAFEEVVGDWLDQTPAAPVILSGMIGSRQGWREAPYLACPANVTDLASAMLALDLAPRATDLDRAGSLAPGCRRHARRDAWRGGADPRRA
jgi:2-dehydro-3-deoxygalactonokinase